MPRHLRDDGFQGTIGAASSGWAKLGAALPARLNISTEAKIVPRCPSVGKAWLLLAAILLTFAVTPIGVMLLAALLAHLL
jgi:hypothetical protein